MKKCSLCQKKQTLDYFNKNKSKKDGLQDICRACNSQNAKRYYKSNKTKLIEKIRHSKSKRIKENQRKLYDLLASSKCVDCLTTNFLSLEFDHRENKRANISRLIPSGCSWNTIEEEIAKCDIRCKGCHTAKTHKEQNSARWQYWLEILRK